jgi:hypothetical protein
VSSVAREMLIGALNSARARVGINGRASDTAQSAIPLNGNRCARLRMDFALFAHSSAWSDKTQSVPSQALRQRYSTKHSQSTSAFR